MAGVPYATLEGWAVPMQAFPRWDHTYVSSSCGLLWGCRGASTGGIRVSSANGSSIIAECLSQPNSLAGIKYGRTGVCHQMANRILHPAQVTVAGCRGYGVSALLYPPFGHPPWPELAQCYPGGTIPGTGTAGAHSSQSSGAMTRKDIYNKAISTAHASTDNEKLRRSAELAALVEMGLGRSLDEATFNELEKIQSNLWDTQTELNARLEAGTLSPEAYLSRINAALKTSLENSQSLLGDEQFDAIFGDAGRHPEGLIDRDTFLTDVRRDLDHD